MNAATEKVMGCLLSRFGFGRSSRHEELVEEAPKQYSWDKRREINVKDYMIENQSDSTLGRVPGQVNGQQFVIQNCKNCNIYVFDYIAAINIDDCLDCNIFLGPVKSSVFVRDCKNCKIVVACQQFRTRDCSKIDIFLCCNTQPIIEASSGMKFACYQYHYPELKMQFKMAGLSVFSNNWGTIHDFSQDPDEQHYSLLPEESKVEDYIPLPSTEQFESVTISTTQADSVVPLTLGPRRKNSDESCLVVFFNDGKNTNSTRARQFIDKLLESQPSVVLVQTRDISMEPSDALRVFGTENYSPFVQRGAVIGLEFNGEGCIELVRSALNAFQQEQICDFFCSESRSGAEKQIEDFYNYADMQMAV